MGSPIIAIAVSALLVALGVLAVSEVFIANARASAAADASALAAADAELGWVTTQRAPCELAAVVSEMQGAALVDCSVDPATGAARVRVRVSTGLLHSDGSAHAGTV